MEVWKDIKGYRGLYRISNHGNIKSLARWVNAGKHGYFTKERILSNKTKSNQYITVALSKDGKRESTRIHRLVAEAFIPNKDNKEQVNHIDLDKKNNNVGNLEWVTPSENIQHAVKNIPNMIKPMNDYNKRIRPKTILQFSMDGALLDEYQNAKMAERKTGILSRNILQVASKDEYKPGKTRKQAGGYIWRFEDEIKNIS